MGFSWENQKGRDSLKNLDVTKKVILKWVLHK
jgi:hypothetical protein